MIDFGDWPHKTSKSSSKIVLVPVPFDKTSSWIKGADRGPKAICAASQHLEWYDRETDFEVYTQGIFTDDPVIEQDVDSLVNSVNSRVSELIQNKKFPVIIGGNHSVSIGSFLAHASHFPDLCILQFDAHSDLRDVYDGSKFNHACVMARARELCKIIQVGIRSSDISELKSLESSCVFRAKDIQNTQSNSAWVDRLLTQLSGSVYITIDLDVLDPSIMPSTGTPEPGGIYWYDLLYVLKKVFESKNVVGFDIVELCPIKSFHAPDFLAAQLIYTLLSYKFGLKQKNNI